MGDNEETNVGTASGSGDPRALRAPPAFSEGQCYEDWKLDLELWIEFTKLEKKKHGTALLLELKEGKVKDAVRSVGKDILKSETGLDEVIKKLDSIYKEDATHLTYRAYCKFEKYERPESMGLQCYISEFEKLLGDLKKQKITLPEEVLAYRVLNSARLPPEKVDLALATVKSLTYKDMCTTIGKIFSVHANKTGLDNAVAPVIKEEPQECNLTGWKGKGQRSNYRGGWRGQRGNNKFQPYNSRGMKSKQDMKCYACNENGHIARFCPKRDSGGPNGNSENQYIAEHGSSSHDNVPDNNESFQETYITLLVTDESNAECLLNNQPELGSLVFDTLACAVIDSGCTKTVVGRNWLNHYIATLDDSLKQLIVTEKCQTPFRFGDGKETISKERIKIPGCIGKSKIFIDTNVVDCEIITNEKNSLVKRSFWP